MKSIPIFGLGLLLAGAVGAQDPTSPPDAAATFAALQAELQEARQAHFAEVRKKAVDAQAGGGDVRVDSPFDATPFLARFEAAAKKFEGSDDAAMFWVWIVQIGGGQAEYQGRAVAALVANHTDSDHVVPLARMGKNLTRVLGEAQGAALFDALKASENPLVKGWMALATHRGTIDSAEENSTEYREARAALVEVADSGMDEGLAKEIRGVIDLREKLGVGGTAPDIVGVDLDGVEFKLSDYKGKVVFLDFWGDW